VLVRMEAVGICRSDLHVAASGETIRFPAVLGHEGAGVVESAGPGTGLSPGTPVVLSWTPRCGRCPRCREGRPQLCESLTTAAPTRLVLAGEHLAAYMGLGCLAEAVVVPEPCAVPVPGGLPAESMCLLGCGVTTGHGAAVHAAGIRLGQTVAVFGCGAVGLSAVQGARLAGARTVVAVDPHAKRRALALELGATEAIDPSTADAIAQIVAGSEGGVDAAIEATGDPEVMARLLDVVHPGGIAVVVGLPSLDASIRVSPFQLLFEKRLTGSIYGSADPPREFPILAELYRQGRLHLDELRGPLYPLNEVNDAMAELAEGRALRPVVMPAA
jgi:S-(hydroxymethyl)glutathione dehydrogenase / alcohol dehydrogenase